MAVFSWYNFTMEIFYLNLWLQTFQRKRDAWLNTKQLRTSRHPSGICWMKDLVWTRTSQWSPFESPGGIIESWRVNLNPAPYCTIQHVEKNDDILGVDSMTMNGSIRSFKIFIHYYGRYQVVNTLFPSGMVLSLLPCLNSPLTALSLLLLLLIPSTEGFMGPHTQKARASTTALNLNPCPEISLEPKMPGNEVACVACGWFWHPQLAFKQMDRVVDCVVGYAGGENIIFRVIGLRDLSFNPLSSDTTLFSFIHNNYRRFCSQSNLSKHSRLYWSLYCRVQSR